MNTFTLNHDTANAFIEKWVDAWLRVDADAAAELFSEDYVYCWHPLESPVVGQDAIKAYWVSEGELQENVNVHWRAPVVDGNHMSFELWCTMNYRGGSLSDPQSGLGSEEEKRERTPREMTGVCCYAVEFNSLGQCREMREYRFEIDGIHPAPEYFENSLSQ